jgi:tetratricopeptide (TPR) repeat protein
MEHESQRHRIERCKKEVAEHPEQGSAHYNLGLAYARSGRVKEAEAAYLEAIDRDPTMVEAWVNLGGIRLMRWDFKGCLEATQRAAKLRDDLPIVHFNMGQAYLYLNDPENLLHCNKRVLELDHEHAAANYYAAVAQLALDDFPAAQRYLGRAMELGHQPPQDFMKAMEKAKMASTKSVVNMIEISGADAPDTTKED